MCKGNARHAWRQHKCSDFERLDDIASNLPVKDTASEQESRDTKPCSDFEHLDETVSNL